MKYYIPRYLNPAGPFGKLFSVKEDFTAQNDAIKKPDFSREVELKEIERDLNTPEQRKLREEQALQLALEEKRVRSYIIPGGPKNETPFQTQQRYNKYLSKEQKQALVEDAQEKQTEDTERAVNVTFGMLSPSTYWNLGTMLSGTYDQFGLEDENKKLAFDLLVPTGSGIFTTFGKLGLKKFGTIAKPLLNRAAKTPKGKALLVNYELAKNINKTNLLPLEQPLKTYGVDNIKKYDYLLGYKTSGIGTKRVKLNSKHWVRDITNKEKPQMLGVRPDTKTIKYQKEVDHYDIKNPEFINIQNKILSLENYIPKETWVLSKTPSFNFKGVSFDNTLYPPKIYNVEKASRLVNQFGTYVSKNPNRYIVREKISEIPITLYHKKGGTIHIKEKNKGKFTEAAKRAGKSVQEHARDVVNNPKATKLQKKRALFALNAKKFKHG